MNRWISVICLVVLVMGSSCTSDRVYEEFHSFETKSWTENDSVFFDISAVKEKDGEKLISVRFNELYPFSNFYVRVLSQDSLGVNLGSHLINVPLFDSKSGQPKGTGFGNTFTHYDTIPFQLPEKTTKLVFLQYMRQAELPGVEAVGLKILK